MEPVYSAAFAVDWGFRPVFRLAYERTALELSTTFDTELRHLVPARVLAEHRAALEVITSDGPLTARLSGRFRHDARDRTDHPAVGDWVVLRPGPVGTVVAVVERQTHMTRQAAGKRTEPQILAANIDTVFIVTSAGTEGGSDFSPRRIERYRHAIAAGGAQPVVVLNKSDLVAPDQLHRLRAQLPRDLPVVALSALHGTGAEELDRWVQPGSTVALVGSSGVGKSTLVNRLHDAEVMPIGPVRDSDATGKHTTTHRQLLRLPSGAMLIDTPGMRELQLWAPQSESKGDARDPVARVADTCRFRDCTHKGEPGCAVEAALEGGELTRYQMEAHDQLQRELAYQRRRQNVSAARAEARKWKKITKWNKERAKRR